MNFAQLLQLITTT